MHLVSSGRFWSRDKDGGHNIQSAIVKNPKLYAASRLHLLQNWSYCQSECWNMKFHSFCSFGLDLNLMTFKYEFDPYALDKYLQTNMNFMRQGFWKSSYRLTQIQIDTSRVVTPPYHVLNNTVSHSIPVTIRMDYCLNYEHLNLRETYINVSTVCHIYKNVYHMLRNDYPIIKTNVAKWE